MKQNKFDKIFKITVMGLLTLILVFQISSSISFSNDFPFGEDYIVDLGYGDFLLGYEISEQKHFHSSYDIYTYEEFSKLINKSIKDNEDLVNYAKEKGYEIYDEEPAFLFIETGKECEYDKIRNIELCASKFIEADKENNQITLSSDIGFQEISMIHAEYEGEFSEHE